MYDYPANTGAFFFLLLVVLLGELNEVARTHIVAKPKPLLAHARADCYGPTAVLPDPVRWVGGGPHDHLLPALKTTTSPYNRGDTTELAMMKATRTLTHRGEDDNKAQARAQWIVWRLEL